MFPSRYKIGSSAGYPGMPCPFHVYRAYVVRIIFVSANFAQELLLSHIPALKDGALRREEVKISNLFSSSAFWPRLRVSDTPGPISSV